MMPRKSFGMARKLALTLSSFTLSACLPEKTMEFALTDPAGASCDSKTFQQPEAFVTKKIDVLWVLDTSGSLDDERHDIADGISRFVQQLPEQADYRFGVLLAHSSRSGWHGKLYRSGANGPVLDAKRLGLDTLRQKLIQLFDSTPTETFSDGGELGLASLNRILDADKLATAKSEGFFREDAALVVVLVSDENDVCVPARAPSVGVNDPDLLETPARRAECGARARTTRIAGERWVPTGEIRRVQKAVPRTVVDQITVEGRVINQNRTVYDPVPGEFVDQIVYRYEVTDPTVIEVLPARAAITPELTYDRLKSLKGETPLGLAGILYTDPFNVPANGENEYGYGYMDLLYLASGLPIDLGEHGIDTGLAEIGKLASQKLQLITSVTLKPEGFEIDPSTIWVKVDTELAPFEFRTTTGELVLKEPGHSLSNVEIHYCSKVAPTSASPSPSPSPSVSPSPGPSPSPTPSTPCGRTFCGGQT